MSLAILVGVLFGLATVAAVLARFVARKLDLFSYQSTFLAGMIFFYYGPMVLIPLTPEFRSVYQSDGSGWTTLAIAVVIFISVYLFFGRLGSSAAWFGRLLPKLDGPVNQPALLTVIATTAASGLFFFGVSFTPGAVGLLDVFLLTLIPNFMSFALGLAVVLLVRQPRNPAWWALAGALFVVGAVVSMSISTDRRFLMGVLLVIPWALYYAWLRYRPAGPTLIVGGLGVFATMTVVLAYTNLRHNIEFQGDVVGNRLAQVQQMISRSPFTQENFTAVFAQDTPLMTLYYIENVPDAVAYQPLHGLIFFFTNPIPRVLWPDKPLAMGIQMMQEVNAPSNLGTGIIGHGWVEAGWLGVLYYAAFFGFLMCAIDRTIRERAGNPYFIILMGCSMANILALPRGETALFLVLNLYGLVAVAGVTWLTFKLFAPLLRSAGEFNFGPPPETDPADEPDRPDEDDADDVSRLQTDPAPLQDQTSGRLG
ncbi:MAG: hypothetical protein LW650_10090 [Planctomycetaceae bacterium]|jgi:hypothetical protein|nr:hypothetical protein [Phycisphaerales bacterium]MCE2653808.1 hypothetical protein [Planctomycetaceae bacterium]